jgi:hypothetical protein
MAGAVSCWPLRTEARVLAQVSPYWDLWWIKWQWDRFFSGIFGFSPVNIFPQRPVRGRGSNTQSLHIDMINMKKIPVRRILRA